MFLHLVIHSIIKDSTDLWVALEGKVTEINVRGGGGGIRIDLSVDISARDTREKRDPD